MSVITTKQLEIEASSALECSYRRNSPLAAPVGGGALLGLAAATIERRPTACSRNSFSFKFEKANFRQERMQDYLHIEAARKYQQL